jgi:hypothetical protein
LVGVDDEICAILCTQTSNAEVTPIDSTPGRNSAMPKRMMNAKTPYSGSPFFCLGSWLRENDESDTILATAPSVIIV